METIAPITALVIAAGTIFSAIYHTKNKAEQTLQSHIQKLDEDLTEMRRLNRENDEKWQKKCDELIALLDKERRRGDRLEKKIKSLTK